MTTQSSLRRPDRAWIVLLALTSLSIAVAALGGEHRGAAAAALVLAATWLKLVQVLDHFLGLKEAGGGWRMLFVCFLAALLAGVLAASFF